jgi:hypothetical protein
MLGAGTAGVMDGGRYLLCNPITRSSAYARWSAWDTCFARRVTLEIVTPEAMLDAAWLTRLLTRARSALEFADDGLVRLRRMARCRDTGLTFLVMDGCAEHAGGSWRDALPVLSSAPRSMIEVVGWIQQAALGLHAAHTRGLFHGRLTPASILILPESRRARVFGIGSVNCGVEQDGDDGVRYRAPEEGHTPACSHARQVRIEIYRLGAILDHLLRVQRGSSIPAQLRRIVSLALENRPDRRYRSCHEFATDLSAFLSSQPASRDGARLLLRARLWLVRHRNVLATLVSILLTLSGMAAYFWAQQDAERIREQIEVHKHDLERGAAKLKRLGPPSSEESAQ